MSTRCLCTRRGIYGGGGITQPGCGGNPLGRCPGNPLGYYESNPAGICGGNSPLGAVEGKGGCGLALLASIYGGGGGVGKPPGGAID